MTFSDGEGRLYPAWSFLLAALLSVLAFFACAYFAGAVTGTHPLRFEVVFRSCLAAVLLAAYSWLLTIANFVDSHRLAAQGFPIAPGWFRHLAAGLAFSFVLVAVGVLAIALIGKLSFRFTFGVHTLSRVLFVLMALLAGSLAEELMFRGYPFQRLVEAVGSGGAIVVFSALFALAHLLNPGATLWGLINTVVIGVMLSVAYLRTRALWLGLGFHFGWNFTLGVIFGLPVSGIRLFNIVTHASASGPLWLTGDSYGIEASLPGAVAVFVALAIVLRLPLRRLHPPLPLEPVESTVEGSTD